MKKNIRNWLVVLFVFGAFCLSATTEAAAQDFTVINKAGFEIHALYMTPHNAKEWGGDILGVDTLPVNDSVSIVFSRKEKSKLWDLRVEDANGAFIEWVNLNLLEISSVTLYYKNSKATAVFDENTESQADFNGTWLGYYEDGTISPYVWDISQTDAGLLIQDADGGKTRSRATTKGNNIMAKDFATVNGKMLPDGNRILWTDGIVWVRANDLIDVTGVWIGYYDDGTKSDYVWSIIQRGTNISIQDTKDKKTKSRGTFKGNKVFAQDFATQNGKLTADGRRINWSDGVFWVKQ